MREKKRLDSPENNSPIESKEVEIKGRYSKQSCPVPIFVAVQEKNQDTKRTRVIKVSCGQWKCAVCGPRKAYKIRKQLLKANWREGRYFITLTLKLNSMDLKHNTKRIQLAWDIFLKQIKRKFPSVKYFKVIEYTKRGMPHLHIITDQRITKKFLRENWLRITEDSFIVDVGKLKQKTCNYIFKYALKICETKRKLSHEIPKGFRFYSSTRGLLLVAKKKSLYVLIDVSTDLKGLLFKLFWKQINECDLFGIVYSDDGEEAEVGLNYYKKIEAKEECFV